MNTRSGIASWTSPRVGHRAGLPGRVQPLVGPHRLAPRGAGLAPVQVLQTAVTAQNRALPDSRARQCLCRSQRSLNEGDATPSSLPDQGSGALAAVRKTVVLAFLFALWYASNIFFNIFNKQVLSTFPYPVTCTAIHLLVGSVIMASLWATNLKSPVHLSPKVLTAVTPLSMLHMLGFLTTNMSLGAVAVSLTHTIKALEPFFTVVLSAIFMGSTPTPLVMSTLIPIVAGVVVASATDVSFNWIGFISAMMSNLSFQARNVVSKKIMVDLSQESLEGGAQDRGLATLDNTNIFACITIGALFLMIPFVVMLDGAALTDLAAASGGFAHILSSNTQFQVIMAGVCRFVDVITSFAILKRVNPVTHSVGNCVKRVVVITASIIFFRTPASMLNIIGISLALSGVFAYSMAKRMQQDRDLRAVASGKGISIASFFRRFVPFKAPPKPKAPKRKEDSDDLEYYL